jgi:uncharacterized protein
MPQQPDFFKFFKELSVKIKEMSVLFVAFCEEFKDFENYRARSKTIENAADDVTHKMINKLNQSFIVPFEREDLYKLTKRMDDLVDIIEHVIQKVHLYQMTEKKPFIDDFARLNKQAAEALEELIVEMFVKQKPTKRINDLVVKLHELEDQADAVYHNSIRQLFATEQNPVNLIKWKDILEDLESTMDLFQKVSDLVEGTIVKSN